MNPTLTERLIWFLQGFFWTALVIIWLQQIVLVLMLLDAQL